jgi:hypothetical protein
MNPFAAAAGERSVKVGHGKQGGMGGGSGGRRT